MASRAGSVGTGKQGHHRSGSMGRILDVLRRKRVQSISSPRGDEACSGTGPSINSFMHQSFDDDELVEDKENGGILNTLRRKRSPRSDEEVCCVALLSPENSQQSLDEAIEVTENESPKAVTNDVMSPSSAGGDRRSGCGSPRGSTDEHKSSQEAEEVSACMSGEEKLTKSVIADELSEECDAVVLASYSESTDRSSEAAAASNDGKLTNDSEDIGSAEDEEDVSRDDSDAAEELTEAYDGVALSLSESTEQSSDAAGAASVSEFTAFTEVSDDGVLRDDEGNPIDPNEAEENMLRDEEGNIIDPKTLVLRDSFEDICNELDEYYRMGVHDEPVGPGEVNPGEVVEGPSCGEEVSHGLVEGPSCTDEVAQASSDDSSESEGPTDAEPEEHLLPHEGAFPSLGNNHDSQGGKSKHPPSPSQYRDDEEIKGIGTGGRRTLSSRRRKRREQGGLSPGKYVHIMFHNKLSTLEEEVPRRQCSVSSDDEADDSEGDTESLESYMSFNDEKYIRARWEYSLRVMNSGMHVNRGALVDARDEINDMLIVNDECSVELETGEV